MQDWSWIKRLPEGSPERREAEQLASEVIALSETNPLQFVHVCDSYCGTPGCKPYPKQYRFTAAREFCKAFFGGNGAGKTHVGIVDDLIQLCDPDVLPGRLRAHKRWDPPFYLRVVAPKFNVIEGAILEKFRDLTPKSQLVGGSFDKAYDKQARKLRFANGSWVLFNTSDQDVDTHAGVRLHRVHFDEEPEGEHGRQVYAENVMRLRDYMPDAQVMFTMTPLFGLSWTYDEVWERRDEDPVFCVVASMLDNPHIDAQALMRELRHLSKEEIKARVEGQFVHFHGLVLARFADEHVVDPPSPDHVRDLDNLVGIDPGMARGGVLWSGFDRENHMLSFDELYPSGLAVPALATEIFLVNARWGLGDDFERRDALELIDQRLKDNEITAAEHRTYRQVLGAPSGPRVTYVIDPSARNRSLTDAAKVEALLARCGIYCQHGQNDRRAGVLQMRARIDAGAWLVSRDCQNLLREIRRWVVARDEDTEQEKPKGGRMAGDTFATRGPDHLCDPARYQCMARLWTSIDVPDRPLQDFAWQPGTAPDASQLVVPTGGFPMGSMS